MIRFFTDIRTEAEIRADMFNAHANMANTGNLVAMYQFDEGTGSTVDNIQGTAANDGTISGASFVGAGTFTYGTSTLTMAKSGSQKINFLSGEDIYNLTVNDGSTTELHCVDTTSGLLDVYGDVVVNEKLKSSSDSANTSLRFREVKTLTIGSDVKTTALSDLYALNLRHSNGTIDLPELTTQRVILASSTNCTARATGDLTITQELELGDGRTFNANTNTIAVKEVDVNGSGTLDLRNSTLDFSVTTSGDTLSIEATGTLTTGNTTITGHTAQQTPAVLPDDGDFEVVGDISNLKIMSGGDLTVIGSVTNCLLQDSTANIRQFFHTLDTQQLLDADEAGDDDLRLEKPTLDNANELQTG
jgi:hypothetical protein